MVRRTLVKVLVGVAILAGLAFLFLKTARDARSAPYSVRGEYVRNWDLAVEQPQDAAGAVLVLRPPLELSTSFLRQVFTREMESLSAPAVPGMPLVLRSELGGDAAGPVSAAELADLAREAGLERASFEPVCLAVRRVTAPGARRQLYFVLFDAPEFDRFRQEAGRLLNARVGARPAFDPAALSPILIVGAFDREFHQWLPLRADPDRDCVAPVERE